MDYSYTTAANEFHESFAIGHFENHVRTGVQQDCQQSFGSQDSEFEEPSSVEVRSRTSAGFQYPASIGPHIYNNPIYNNPGASQQTEKYPRGHIILDDVCSSLLRGWSPRLEVGWRIFWARCWESEAFYKYRTTAPKADKVQKEDDKKWTHLREEMFFRAIYKSPPTGRVQVKAEHLYRGYHDKMMGRNELVANYVNLWLDLEWYPEKNDDAAKAAKAAIPVERQCLHRKQISSHLQVLKKKFACDPWIIDVFLASPDDKQPRVRGEGRSHMGRASSARQRSSRFLSRSNPSRVALAAHARPLQLSQTPTLPSQTRRRSYNSLEPADFCMYLADHKCEERDKCTPGRDCKYETVHTFTRSQKNVHGPDTILECSSSMAAAFPGLDAIGECQVLLAEASLALPDPGMNVERYEITINNSFNTGSKLDDSLQWYVKTVFFEGEPRMGQDAIRRKMTEEIVQDVKSNWAEGKDFHEHVIPFASSYWVQKIVRLRAMQRDAEKAAQGEYISDIESRYPTRSEQDFRDMIKKDIRWTVARQEIFSQAANGKTESALVIYWHFKQTSHPDEVGTVVFRNIIVRNPEHDMETDIQLEARFSNALVPYGMDSHVIAVGASASIMDDLGGHSLDEQAQAQSTDLAAVGPTPYNFDWSGFAGLGSASLSSNGAMADAGQAFAGAEDHSALLPTSTTPYVLHGSNEAVSTAAEDAGFALDRQAPVLTPDTSASASSCTTPPAEGSAGSDYFVSANTDSQTSEVSSAYAASSQLTCGSAPAAHDYQYDVTSQEAYSFDNSRPLYHDNHHNLLLSQHNTHEQQHGHHYQRSPMNLYQQMCGPDEVHGAAGHAEDTNSEDTIRPWQYAQGPQGCQQYNYAEALVPHEMTAGPTHHYSSNHTVHHYAGGDASQHFAQPHQKVHVGEETQTATGASNVAEIYDANFFANAGAAAATAAWGE